MKKTISILLLIAICLSAFSACANPGMNEQPDTPGEYEFICSDYKVIGKNNEFYIVFDDINMYQRPAIGGHFSANVTFPTMKDFKDSVTKGLLTDLQKQDVADLPKNSAGAIMTCDFENLYVPTLPKNGVVKAVGWSGQTYGFTASLSDEVWADISYMTKDSFDSRYQRDYLDFFNRDLITVTKTQTLNDGKIATYYTTRAGEFMKVRYTITVGSKVITVDKKFRLQMEDPDLPTSATVPADVDLYITSGNKFCHVDLSGLSEDPTDAWLSRFGLEKYVDKT